MQQSVLLRSSNNVQNQHGVYRTSCLGLQATNTIERINFLEQEGSLSDEMAEGLREAYYLLTKQRIMLQIKQINGQQKDSYYLNPLLLSHDDREDIRQAVIRIEELQKLIHTNFNIV